MTPTYTYNEHAQAIEKLEARLIKAANPTKLKEWLKERGLSTQGAKKELMDRLLAHEAKR